MRYFTHYRQYMIFERLDMDGFCPSFDTEICGTLEEVKEAIDTFWLAQDDEFLRDCVVENKVEISPSLRWYNICTDIDTSPLKN